MDQTSRADLHFSIEAKLGESTGEPAKIVASSSIGGGCINDAEVVTLSDGRTFFVKSNPNHNLFEAEAVGLATIKTSDAIRVPNVVTTGTTRLGLHFLILEQIKPGRPSKDFFETFGRSLAQMHRADINKFSLQPKLSHLDHYGFASDNHIGSTVQLNTWTSSWVEFFAEYRLGYQLKLAAENGYAKQLQREGKSLIASLDELIGQTYEPPSLIHGDLWSGNFMVSSSDEAVLIDPAVYFASRECEFAMTKLFGGFNSQFYSAYNEAYPLNDDWETRVEIYQLYHLLNHLNLFGASYLDQCLATIRKFT